MDFCPKCGSILVPEKKGSTVYMVCRKCKYKTKKASKTLKISDKPVKKGVVVLESNETNLPVTDKMCPKCENMKAYWWLQQTRSVDEPPTQFFKCTKCNYIWREYK